MNRLDMVSQLCLDEAALRIAAFVDALIKHEVSNIDGITLAVAPVIVAQVYTERDS